MKKLKFQANFGKVCHWDALLFDLGFADELLGTSLRCIRFAEDKASKDCYYSIIGNAVGASINAIDWVIANWLEESQSEAAGEEKPADLPVADAQMQSPVDPMESDHRISDDGRSLNWFGKTYTFTPYQAAMVKVLFDNFTNGTPLVGSATLLEAADSRGQKVSHIFRNSPAWKTIIFSPAKGLYKLEQPGATNIRNGDAITPKKHR